MLVEYGDGDRELEGIDAVGLLGLESSVLYDGKQSY